MLLQQLLLRLVGMGEILTMMVIMTTTMIPWVMVVVVVLGMKGAANEMKEETMTMQMTTMRKHPFEDHYDYVPREDAMLHVLLQWKLLTGGPIEGQTEGTTTMHQPPLLVLLREKIIMSQGRTMTRSCPGRSQFFAREHRLQRQRVIRHPARGRSWMTSSVPNFAYMATATMKVITIMMMILSTLTIFCMEVKIILIPHGFFGNHFRSKI
mmetsp:Transcript_21734/g.34090  ORF Transcript_21734/g.34090 Transcript_21734/m.34090 type:complete len:210 (+) Transcript_21734:996-1625(+)